MFKVIQHTRSPVRFYSPGNSIAEDNARRQSSATKQDLSSLLDVKLQQTRLRYEGSWHKSRGQIRLQLLSWMLRDRLATMLRRPFDIVVASVALVGVSPLMLIASLAVKLDSPGPVLFKQKRVGQRGEDFTIYKFRSMVTNAEALRAELRELNEADDVVFKLRNDPRVTRTGHIIRRLSIDELPQLFNVLKGDMRLVGPRPALPDEVETYDAQQLRRLEAMPGITGLQQISGRSNLSFERWIELDLQYVEEQGLLNDVAILLKTVPVVLARKGAY